MKANKKPKVRQITREEWLDMVTYPEKRTPTETGSQSTPSKMLVAMKKNINGICNDIQKVLLLLEDINTPLPIWLPGNFKFLLKDAALTSEQITRRLRHLLYLATDIRKPEYLVEAEKQLDMTVNEHDGIVELTFPGLVPKAKSWKSSEYLTDPAYFMIERYLGTHKIHRFDECTVCFIHEYDKSLGIGRVLDYDNTEQKQLLDVVATFFLKDDGGLHCDAYHTTVLGEKDITRILIMSKEQFPKWLSSRYDS